MLRQSAFVILSPALMPQTSTDIADIKEKIGSRNIVLVGLMGAGKTTVGRRLARLLKYDFTDADAEIEKAAGLTVAEIFETYGEQHFRDGERKVIARLLQTGPKVLATGGGAFMNAEIRESIAASGLSVWLKADLDLLMKRVGRRTHRPLLQRGDPEEIMSALIKQRYPVYAQADFVIQSRDVPHDVIVNEILEAFAAMPGAPERDQTDA